MLGVLNQKVRYALSEILENGSERYWWRDRFIKRVVGPTQRTVYGFGDSIDPFRGDRKHSDWDILIILDACRADLLEETLPDSKLEPTTFKTVTSAGSSTPEWTRRLLTDKSYGDIVYVTANPWIARLAPESFHDRIDVWTDGFDEDLGTVPPETTAESACVTYDEYPNKRLVVHFMQPHVPFIGSERWRGSRQQPTVEILNEEIEASGKDGEFGELRYGDLSRKALWPDYKATLKLVLEEIQDLRKDLSGRMIVTSDHGNMFGERAWPFPIRIYGHPGGLRSSPLVKVPWAVFESPSDRPEIREGGTNHIPPPRESDTTNERLQALGYRE